MTTTPRCPHCQQPKTTVNAQSSVIPASGRRPQVDRTVFTVVCEQPGCPGNNEPAEHVTTDL